MEKDISWITNQMKFIVAILISDKAIFGTRKSKCDGILHNNKVFIYTRRCNVESHTTLGTLLFHVKPIFGSKSSFLWHP